MTRYTKLTHLFLVALTGFSLELRAEEILIKIGHVAPTSGAIAHLGKDNENGAQMAIEELNAKGVMIGGKKARFELVTEDEASGPKQGEVAAKKLVDAKVNGVIGHLNSGTTLPVSKIYNDAGIVQISSSATSAKYTLQGFQGAFNLAANTSQMGSTLGRFAVQVNGAKKIVVIDDNTAYGEGLAEEFIKASKSKEVEVVSLGHINDKSTDFSSILSTIKAQNPDVIFFGGMDFTAASLLRQMKGLGIKAKLMGGDGICTDELAKFAGDSIGEGQVICVKSDGALRDQKNINDDWKTAYKKKFGVNNQIYSPSAYDSVMVMAEAMKKAGSANPAKYGQELKSIQYKGITGNIAFDEKGNIKNGPGIMYTYRDGKQQTLPAIYQGEFTRWIENGTLPMPTDFMLLQDSYFVKQGINQTLGNINDKLQKALQNAGYVGRHSYWIMNGGFALAARMEHIDSDARPFSGEDRWILDPTVVNNRSLLESMFDRLFTAAKGYYRVVVFAVTDDQIVYSDNPVTEKAMEDLIGRGYDTLPAKVAGQEFGTRRKVRALVYEIIKEDAKDPKIVKAGLGMHDARMHLERAGLLKGLGS